MQKSGTTTTTKIEKLLDSMDYNEEQQMEQDFTSILNWITKRGDKIESIVQGSCLKGSSKHEFRIGVDKTVSICYLDETKLKQCLESEDANEKCVLSDKEQRLERLSKFKKLVADLGSDLCAAESIATHIPVWQVKEFDQPNWQHQIAESSSSGVAAAGASGAGETGKKKIIFIGLSLEEYSMQKMLPIFSTIVASDEKFILVMNSRTAQDSCSILPIAYLVDAMNTAKIRKWPIDLLLLDPSLEQTTIRFLQTSKKIEASQVHLWGDLLKFNNFPSQLPSGVVIPGAFGARAHFIFDSLADVQTTVDSIVAEVWSSGGRVNQRTRSVLFIHQPIYKRVIELLEKKMTLLKTSGDVGLRSNEFIKRDAAAFPAAGDVEKILKEGVKIFPSGSDFSIPTLLYNIGTSCDIMASSSPALGHLLFAISYRNHPELLSLANNYGDNNQVFIHSQDWANIKTIATNIKASNIWVNSGGRPGLAIASNQVLSKLSPSMQQQEAQDESHPTKTEIDEFTKCTLVAEKALKVWSATGTEKKYSSVVEAFLSAVEQKKKQSSSGSGSDRFHLLNDLMRVAGRMFNESENRLMLTQYKPYGIVAIAFLNPENISLEATLLPILLALLKGNTVLVVSTSNPHSGTILETFKSIFPPGSVQFLQSTNFSRALQLASHPGKVSLLWIIHSGQGGPQTNQIPFTSFNKVIVNPADAVEKSVVTYAKELEHVKNTFL